MNRTEIIFLGAATVTLVTYVVVVSGPWRLPLDAEGDAGRRTHEAIRAADLMASGHTVGGLDRIKPPWRGPLGERGATDALAEIADVDQRQGPDGSGSPACSAAEIPIHLVAEIKRQVIPEDENNSRTCRFDGIFKYSCTTGDAVIDGAPGLSGRTRGRTMVEGRPADFIVEAKLS